MRRALVLLLLVAGCGGKPPENAAQSQDLESAAIDRGMVRDPRDTEIVGLYARDTDRVCIVRGDSGYRIGAFVDYGDRITCSGAGTVTRVGEMLHVQLGADEAGCSFDARFDGDKIYFPGNVPDGCAKLCARRASYAGSSSVAIERVGCGSPRDARFGAAAPCAQHDEHRPSRGAWALDVNVKGKYYRQMAAAFPTAALAPIEPRDDREHFSISDLCAEFGVTARALRFYEDEGLIGPERRGDPARSIRTAIARGSPGSCAASASASASPRSAR